jgi:hypothetical protein
VVNSSRVLLKPRKGYSFGGLPPKARKWLILLEVYLLKPRIGYSFGGTPKARKWLKQQIQSTQEQRNSYNKCVENSSSSAER